MLANLILTMRIFLGHRQLSSLFEMKQLFKQWWDGRYVPPPASG